MNITEEDYRHAVDKILEVKEDFLDDDAKIFIENMKKKSLSSISFTDQEKRIIGRMYCGIFREEIQHV